MIQTGIIIIIIIKVNNRNPQLVRGGEDPKLDDFFDGTVIEFDEGPTLSFGDLDSLFGGEFFRGGPSGGPHAVAPHANSRGKNEVHVFGDPDDFEEMTIVAAPIGISPFQVGPDPFIREITSHMSPSRGQFLPGFVSELERDAVGGFVSELERDTVDAMQSGASSKPCKEYVNKFNCHDAPLQCLAMRQSEIGSECRQSIEKSVPFQCALEIQTHHCDGVTTPLIACLMDKVGSLSRDCEDSIKTTRSLIETINTSPSVTINKNGQSLASHAIVPASSGKQVEILPSGSIAPNKSQESETTWTCPVAFADTKDKIYSDHPPSSEEKKPQCCSFSFQKAHDACVPTPSGMSENPLQLNHCVAEACRSSGGEWVLTNALEVSFEKFLGHQCCEATEGEFISHKSDGRKSFGDARPHVLPHWFAKYRHRVMHAIRLCVFFLFLLVGIGLITQKVFVGSGSSSAEAKHKKCSGDSSRKLRRFDGMNLDDEFNEFPDLFPDEDALTGPIRLVDDRFDAEDHHIRLLYIYAESANPLVY